MWITLVQLSDILLSDNVFNPFPAGIDFGQQVHILQLDLGSGHASLLSINLYDSHYRRFFPLADSLNAKQRSVYHVT